MKKRRLLNGVYSCPSCHKVIAKEDRRRMKYGSLTMLNGTRITLRGGEAPRLHCPCGQLLILLKGSL